MKDPERWYGLDLLRALCLLGVVAVHSLHHGMLMLKDLLAGFVVPCFILISIMLTMKHVTAEPPPRYGLLWKRLTRLVPAYLAWSLVY